MKISAQSDQPITNTVKFYLDTSPPKRVQPALLTGTQGEEGIHLYGIGVTPPLVERLGTSGELGSLHKMSDRHSTTMVRVIGSSGDSGLHREYRSEKVKIKMESGIESSEAEGSPQTRDFIGFSRLSELWEGLQ